jgi:hypothetical protein
MYSLQILDDEQLSYAMIQAVKLNLETDFIHYLKNEAIRRLKYLPPNDLSQKSLQAALDILFFKRELDHLYQEHLRCNDQTIRNQISNDISLIESVIESATKHAL